MSLLNTQSAEAAHRTPFSGLPHHHVNNNDDPVKAVRCFAIRADLEPGLLPRLMEAFAKRGLWPSKFYSQTIAADRFDDTLEAMIDIQVIGLDQLATDHIAMQFRGMVGVQSVLTGLRATSD